MGGILIVAEQRDGELKKVTLEMVGKARSLAGDAAVSVALVGRSVSPMVAGLAGLGVSKVYVAEADRLEHYQPEIIASVLSDLIQSLKPEIILLAATSTGKDLAPRLAGRLNAGLASDCTDLSREASSFVATRPIYAGKAIATVGFQSEIKLATVRPNVLPVPEKSSGDAPPVETLTVPSLELRSVVKEILKQAGEQVELTEANVIVSGGRGMKGPENFAMLGDLAHALGGAVGASRSAVDEGWIDHSHQVGQTGKTVTPTLYIACGISGAIQHLAGMRNSKVIVAINKDPEAPIFKVADFGIEGDLFEMVPAITREVKALKS